MDDQGSETSTSETQGEAPAVKDSGPDAGALDKLRAEVEALAASKSALEMDAKKYRDRIRAMKEEDEQAKKKAGEFEPIIEARDARIAELEAQVAELSGPAKEHAEWVKAEEAEIATLAEGLDDAAAAIVAALPLSQRRAALERFSGSKTKERPPEHPAAEPSPPDPSSGAVYAGISEKDPTAWAKIKEAAGISGPPNRRTWVSQIKG